MFGPLPEPAARKFSRGPVGGNHESRSVGCSRMSDAISKFIDFMASVGCAPETSSDISADDKMTRFRLAGDKPKVLNGSYVLRVDADGFACGGCKSFRDGVWHSWHVRSGRGATEEEKQAWAEKREKAKEQQDALRAAAAASAAEKASAVWKAADRTGSNDYLTRKGLDLTAIGCRMSRGDVVVPMWSGGITVGVQFIMPDGDKRFISGCAKEGSYHAIKGSDGPLIIGEGLATVAVVQRATGLDAIVAFDAGNLRPVAEAMREKFPDREIIFAADNDQWTLTAKNRPKEYAGQPGDDPLWSDWRAAGLCVNTGVEKAGQAAAAIGGALVLQPPIPADDKAKRTDWWDYWSEHGDAAIREVFDTARGKRVEQPPEPEYDPGYMDYVPGDGYPVDDDQGGPADDFRSHVRPLGYNDKTFYFYSRQAGQIVAHTATALVNQQILVSLAPEFVWRNYFDGMDKKSCSAAANALIAACMMEGIYDDERERGVGVWIDRGVPVFNNGRKLFYAGKECHPSDFKSEFVYVMGAAVGRLVDDDMTNKEASDFLGICLSATWRHKQMGYMVAGWVVTSLIAGALRWRSHIVITGEKGAGKSWVVNNIVKRPLGRMMIERDGGSTEARIRTDLASKTIPAVMDEAEAEQQKDRTNMDGIFMLARKASSGTVFANANGVYWIRSSFCFSAINPRIVHGADLDRITFCHLRRNRRSDAKEFFKALEARAEEVLTPQYADRLFARVFSMVPTILKNVETFSDVMMDIGGSRRFGDQFGTLIAGAYALVSRDEITPEKAREWCSKYEWGWATEDNSQSDSEKLMEFILSSRIRYDFKGMIKEATVGKLIDMALYSDDGDRIIASDALGEIGITVDRQWLTIASPCRPMAELLKDTNWTGSYRRALSEMQGAEPRDKMRFGSAIRARAIAVPLSVALGDVDDTEVELPLVDGEF